MGHDHELFVAHYEKTKDALFTYLMTRLSFDKERAEDLLMDIVLKAYQHFHRFDPEKGSFKTWIFAIAHNHLINAWRDARPTVSLDGLEEAGVQIGELMNDSSAQHFSQKQVQHILALLESRERYIITWRYLNDLSFEEMETISGVKMGTLRARLSRALQTFKTLYIKHYSNYEG